MQIEQISRYGYMLTHDGNYNAFLVRQDLSFTLIDTTMPGRADDILAELKRLSDGSTFVLGEVVITHGHLDHVGSVDELMDRLPSMPLVASSAREARLLRRPADRSTDATEPASEVKGNFPGIAHPAIRHLADQELVGALRCVHTPGHTPGHISLFDERDGTLYAGDAIVTHGGSPHICGFGPQEFLGPSRATWDTRLAQVSAEKLRSLPVERVVCGHGPVLEGKHLIAEALQAARRTGPLQIA